MSKKSLSNLKVAFVTDWMIGPSGSDRYMLSLLELFPSADIYTAAYFEDKYQNLPEFSFDNQRVFESFIARIPFYRKLHRHLNVLTPTAFETFDFSGYDLVVTMSAGFAKAVVTPISTLQVDIIFTPPRSLWDVELRDIRNPVKRSAVGMLRSLDYEVVQRSQHMIAISKFIQGKVEKYYQKKSELIYPGVDMELFESGFTKRLSGNVDVNSPFMLLSRLYRYKEIDRAIEAVIGSGKSLVIVGDGPDRARLESIAGKHDVRFTGTLSDDEVIEIMVQSQALIFPGIEDFGYVPVEAMAVGLPVIAYNEGGVAEIVDPSSGVLFDQREELVDTLIRYNPADFDSVKVRERADYFSKAKFLRNFAAYLSNLL